MHNQLKKTLLLVLLVGMYQLKAQNFSHPIWPEKDKPKTLLNAESDLKAFASLEAKYANLTNSSWVFMGAQAGLIINDHFLLGLAGFGLISNVEIYGSPLNSLPNTNLDVYGGYGGLLLGAKIAPGKLLHFNAPIIVAGGNFELSDGNFFGNANADYTVERSACFVLEPGLELEVNITRKIRIGIGGSYRLVSGTNLFNLTDKQLSGMSTQFSVKFGRY